MTNVPVQEALSTLRMLDEGQSRQRLSEPTEDFRAVLARSLSARSPSEPSDSRRSEFLASHPRADASAGERSSSLASNPRAENERQDSPRSGGDPHTPEAAASDSQRRTERSPSRAVEDAEARTERPAAATEGDHGEAGEKDARVRAERDAGKPNGRDQSDAGDSATKRAGAEATPGGEQAKGLAARAGLKQPLGAKAAAEGLAAQAALTAKAAKAAEATESAEAATRGEKVSRLVAKIGAERVVKGANGKANPQALAATLPAKESLPPGKKQEAAEVSAAQAAAAQLLAQLAARPVAGSATVDPSKGERSDGPAAKANGLPATGAQAPAQGAPQLTVIDLRGAAHHTPVEQSSPTNVQASPTPTNQHTVEVRLYGVANGSGPAGGSSAGAGSLFKMDAPFAPSRQAVMDNLQQTWGPLMNQVVKSTGIVLKDGSSGEIRLLLKPEHLGSVRIQLEMKDNLISGKIVVENQNVRQLFQQNLESLYRAFQESGFSTASLNVSVNGNGTGSREKGRYSGLPAVSAVAGTQNFVDHIPDLRLDGNGDSLINLVV